ncbi:tyrosine-type recombinase/integrase [Lacticaseibacillus daqingensis]|uniref:tyrosine-type recombinase/integrase n=1 Tax=Lacticaseibacillus daqingensis TaxID=2486014 RepID=UPI000F78D093|nr:site-specific integrase [Lacticaseibacillus daqingensis]
MASITTYTTKAGEERYQISVFVGRDDLTSRPRYLHKRGFTSKKEATLAASRLTLDAAGDDLTKRKRLRFRDVYEQWYLSYVNEVAESTYAKTRGMFDNHILPFFGDRHIGDISTAQLQKAVNHWAKEVTHNNKGWFGYVSAVLQYAQEQGYIPANPAKRVKVPKQQRKPGDAPENFWDRQELAAFFGYIDQASEPQKYALFRVLAFGGLRRGEVLALTWGDVSFSDGAIRVNKTLTQGVKGKQIVQAPKTPKSRRTVAMDDKTMAALRTWRVMQLKKLMAQGFNGNTPDQLIFSSRNNTHMFLYQPSKWLRAIEDADAKAEHPQLSHPITTHGFRHSHASACFAAGMTIKEVQDRLGHEDAQTTLNVYTHVTKGQGEKAAVKVANYLGF